MNENANANQPLEAELDHTELRAKTSAITSPEREIDISFLLHRKRKSTRLIGNTSEDNWITARRDWLRFDFDQYIYVTKIDIFASGYEEYHEMEISVIDAFDNSTYTEKRKYNGESFRFSPRRFIRGFGLDPDRPIFKSAQITSISIHGIEQESFSNAVNVVFDIERVRDAVEARLNKYLERAKASEEKFEKLSLSILEQQSEYDENSKEISRLEAQVDKLSVDKEEIERSISRNQALIKESNERRVALENSISDRENHISGLNAQFHEAQYDLKLLKDNINLFPTEIAGFVSQGTQHIRTYGFVMVVPLFVICFVTYRLFANAETLLSFYADSSEANIFEFLVSRLPYVVVSGTILAICFAICRVLISEIITINRRRQELYKVSIIASDVAYASQDSLDIDETLRYELRTQTKMELLKEHLRMNIGQDFVYSPGAGYKRRLKMNRSDEDGVDVSSEAAGGAAATS